jgi:hypothetical protein
MALLLEQTAHGKRCRHLRAAGDLELGVHAPECLFDRLTGESERSSDLEVVVRRTGP